MKSILTFSVTALSLLMSGCAVSPEASTTAVSEKNCKIVNPQTARINYDPAKQTSLDQAEARAHLANSQYRRALLTRSEGISGTLEQLLRDCD
ncbi:MAG: hypothetical protein JNM52_04370 [Betaproteobacteria bacterium]|nr:hypothetical protein [Betaproteobacteria bacterium]